MSVDQSYKTDAWSVSIEWGRDVSGNEDDREVTLVIVEAAHGLTQDDAIEMARYILEQVADE